MKKRIIFHIGLPKTGTTFLQKNVFPYFGGITYFNCIEYWRGEDKMFLNPFYLEFKEGINLVSDERICGLGYLKLPYDTIWHRLNVLRNTYPDAEIIFVQRDTDAWIKSLYKQYAKYSYGVLDFKDWFMKEFDISMYSPKVIGLILKTMFKKVLILNYEDLVKSPYLFIEQITNFLDIPMIWHYKREWIHVSPSDESIKSIVKLNRCKWLPWWIKKPIRMLWRQNHG